MGKKKKLEEETPTTSQKMRPQKGRERERQKLWLLWQDRRANVMDEYQFKALKHRSQEVKELTPSRDTLKTLQSDLTVKGEFTATLWNKNTEQVFSDAREDRLSVTPK